MQRIGDLAGRCRACTSARLSAWKTVILPMLSIPIHDVRLPADHKTAIKISGHVALHKDKERSLGQADSASRQRWCAPRSGGASAVLTSIR